VATQLVAFRVVLKSTGLVSFVFWNVIIGEYFESQGDLREHASNIRASRWLNKKQTYETLLLCCEFLTWLFFNSEISGANVLLKSQ
jgi:hypothetical protein